jgi:hypothetical protein
MCPVCMTTAVLVAAGSTSGAGTLGLAAVKFRWVRRMRRTGGHGCDACVTRVDPRGATLGREQAQPANWTPWACAKQGLHSAMRRLRNRTVSRPRPTRFLKPLAIEEAAEPAAAAEPKIRRESIAEPKLVATHEGYGMLLSEWGKWCRENGRADLATVFDDAQILERYEHG